MSDGCLCRRIVNNAGQALQNNNDSQKSVKTLDLPYFKKLLAHRSKTHNNPKANALGVFVGAGVMVFSAAEL